MGQRVEARPYGYGATMSGTAPERPDPAAPTQPSADGGAIDDPDSVDHEGVPGLVTNTGADDDTSAPSG
jgi:hypothetical protein